MAEYAHALFSVPPSSLSLKLAHDIGYWDTWPDAIGEDMHMFIKAFQRTNGATQLHPIHAPINMTHVQGPTWVRSLWARFLQVRTDVQGGGGGNMGAPCWGLLLSVTPWCVRSCVKCCCCKGPLSVATATLCLLNNT